jgi:hypothetical protein
MKQIDFEEIRNHLSAENRLWCENDATRGTIGHVGRALAWQELFGESIFVRNDPVADFPVEDPDTVRVYPKGRVLCSSPEGDEIYQIPEAAMRELGLVEKADDNPTYSRETYHQAAGRLDRAAAIEIAKEALQRCARMEEGYAVGFQKDAQNCTHSADPVIQARAPELSDRAQACIKKARAYKEAAENL